MKDQLFIVTLEKCSFILKKKKAIWSVGTKLFLCTSVIALEENIKL